MGSTDELMRIILGQQAQPDFSQGDYYRDFAGLSDQMGQSIIQNRGNYGTGEAIAGALITGLLGGGFGRASRDYQAGQQADYTKAILDSFSGRRPMEQGDLSDSLFDVAQSKANVLDLMRSAEEKSALAEYNRRKAENISNKFLDAGIIFDEKGNPINIPALDPSRRKYLDKQGELRGEDDFWNPKEPKPLVSADQFLRNEMGEPVGSAAPLVATVGKNKNPNSPQYKVDQDLYKIEQDYTNTLLTGNEGKQALMMNRAATNIMEALQKDSPLAASTAIFEYAKLQDPAGSVKEGDELRVADPGGPLGYLARIHNEIVQKGKLTVDQKAAMRELVPILQKNTFANYNMLRDKYLEAAKGYGADPSRIKYVDPADLSKYLEATTTTVPPGGPVTQSDIDAEIARRAAGAGQRGPMTQMFYGGR